MTVAPSLLFDLLPQILRLRDAAQEVVTPGLVQPADRATLISLTAQQASGPPLTGAQAQELAVLEQAAMGGPLASLLAIFTEQVAALQEDLDQLYDDQFIETCADWVVPYVGDLIGYRALYGVTPAISSPRAEVAHTISYRRRKGTITVLEQLARDVTGWNATAVEFFQRLIVTQYMNHLRPQCLATTDLRDGDRLERVGGAFDTVMRTVDMRRIESGRGRYNIPNVGVYLWRLDAYSLSHSPAAPVDARRWRFHPLGIDLQLVTQPSTETTVTQLATPLNVPEPISRRVLDARAADYYTGTDNTPRSLRLYVGPAGNLVPIPPGAIRVCNLADDGASWAHLPPTGVYAIDPVLGRIALPPGPAANTEVAVDFHYAFGAPIGGGEYARPDTTASASPPRLVRVPHDQPTIATALAALGGAGTVEITDSGRYAETLTIDANAGQRVTLQARDGSRPTLVLGGELALAGGAGSSIALDGLLIAAHPVRTAAQADNQLARLTISHCTLVPGLALLHDGTPRSRDQPSLIIDVADIEVTIDHTILGGLRAVTSATVALSDSILDATATTGVAFAATDNAAPGGTLSLNAVTVIGKVNAQQVGSVSNSILLAALAAGDASQAPVIATRRQTGCVRFSYLPTGARVPRRYECLPDPDADPRLSLPVFTSLRYGAPGYAQLAAIAGASLQTGADDEGQPGAFHSVYAPRRERNLQVRLAEYLRTSLEAGIFHAS